MTDGKYQLSIPIKQYSLLLLLLTLFLISAHVLLYLYHYRIEELPWLLLQLFDLDEENNIPTWYSSFLLLNCAFLLLLISRVDAIKQKIYWQVLAVGFLLLSFDEVAGMHETINSAIVMNWAIPFGILVLVIGAVFIPFLLALPRRQALLYLASGFVYVFGVIIVELLSEDLDSNSLFYMMAVAVEEGMEMLGALMFIFVNLRMMSSDGTVISDVSVD